MATAAFILLLISAGGQIFILLLRRQRADAVSHWPVAAAALLLLGELIRRSVAIDFVAVTGIFESLLFFAAFLAAAGFAYHLQRRLPFYRLLFFGLTVLTIALLAVASSPIAPADLKPPVPALQSSWLVLHVAFAFLGEVFFAAAFVASLIFVLTKSEERRRGLDRIIYTSVGIGYPLYTLGALIFGAIWAEQAWGRYWSWDPKETWALITWLVFTLYLHLRLVCRNTSTAGPIIVILGFLIALFTFLGVNYLLPGLHSYT
ncbi:MAG: cytochrome c biogenesis protein CcsA [Spirochaetia bacterium]|nr:cytochrome c biogenesis protein CcsA [Spirochaetia bacterium]